MNYLVKNNDNRSNNEDWWCTYAQQTHADKTLAIHSGYYEKGIRSYQDAIINKNNLIDRLLGLDNLDKKAIILDAGCGVGGTSIYLAKKYPHIKFIGINKYPNQINLANKFAQQHNVSSNTEFISGDYLTTGLPDNSVNGIFALEAITHLKDKKKFLKETKRILKQNKKLVIDDAFLLKKPSNYFMKLAYDAFCKTWRIPNIESLKDFIKHMDELKFDNIKTIDITKNSWFSYFIIYLKFISYAIFSRSKKSVENKSCNKNNKKYPISKNLYIYLITMISTSIFLLLNHNLRMIVITAVKK